ncbi:hypothetical protein LZ31DRAFT_576551 [Colletotrichum somersetense]|nr:hypothetical protein LZ31DRAFT_576551 [Colletotrichum somersetense]
MSFLLESPGGPRRFTPLRRASFPSCVTSRYSTHGTELAIGITPIRRLCIVNLAATGLSLPPSLSPLSTTEGNSRQPDRHFLHTAPVMFELPDAKRVRREDLDESSEVEADAHDEQQDAELLAKLHARMAGMLDLSGIDQQEAPENTKTTTMTTTDGPGRDAQDGEGEGDGGAEEFEFRLFATTDPATKIALVDEDERALMGDGAMLRQRPLSYYIADEPTPEARAEMAFAAVSGDEVLARARQRWWGMEMPWRVTRVPGGPSGTASKTAAAANSGDGAAEEEEAAAARRRRPGKKKRVALRIREREKKKKAEEQERAKMGKEEALKEKKKRLNRLKKLRKRAKAKEGKKADGDGGPAEGDESGSGSEGADE